jgi:tRNA (uracil-5-)-methyltransferase TRM9
MNASANEAKAPTPSPFPAAVTGETPRGHDGGQHQPHQQFASPEDYEAAHVHSVYQAIAPHFSATRHKPWPRIASFLLSLSPGSVGIDVGCGNGKYLAVNPSLYILGSDRSSALVHLARHPPRYHPGTEAERGEDKNLDKVKKQKHAGEHADDHEIVDHRCKADVLVADGLSLPHKPSSVDFAISVAVVHHLSTPARRRAAIAALLSCVRGHGQGRVLVYVWALEQPRSRRGWDVGSSQDTLVPWVLREKKKAKQAKAPLPPPSKGTADAAGDADDGKAQDDGNQDGEGQGKDRDGKTFQRYYHLYREGELEEDVVAAGGTVLDSGYEKDNWWVICSKQGE